MDNCRTWGVQGFQDMPALGAQGFQGMPALGVRDEGVQKPSIDTTSATCGTGQGVGVEDWTDTYNGWLGDRFQDRESQAV